MNRNDLSMFTSCGVKFTRSDEEIEEIDFDQLPEGFVTTCLLPEIMERVSSSRRLIKMWDILLTVIEKSSKRKYIDEEKRLQSMNMMLFNEAMKAGIEFRTRR